MDKRGFSLLESLIAVIILSLIMFGLVGVYISGRTHIAHSRNLISATELGRYYLSTLQLQVRQDKWNTNCLGAYLGNNCIAAAETSQSLNTISFTPQIVVSDAPGSTTVRRVKLTLNWNEP